MNKEQGFLVVLLALSLGASALLLMPFLQYVLGAVIVAYMLYPVNERLVTRLGSQLAPAALISAAVVAVFVPLAYISWVLVTELRSLSQGETGIETEAIETTIAETTGQEVEVAELSRTAGSELLGILFGDVTAAASVGVRFSFGIALLLFLLYYLLRDGDRFVAWLIDVAPMRNAVCSRLFDRIDKTTHGVIVSHLLVAVVQGVVGGVGLFLAGIPKPVFFTFTMIMFALLPLVGAFVVWGPAAAYLFAIGQTEWGIFLFVYGIFVVSLIDNYLRPIVIDREAHLNPGVILIGVFGGIYAIGVTGLFIGPIIFAVAATTVTAFNEEYDALKTSIK
ncbi:MAG: AI-2E family transporter [Halovenus sp.]